MTPEDQAIRAELRTALEACERAQTLGLAAGWGSILATVLEAQRALEWVLKESE